MKREYFYSKKQIRQKKRRAFLVFLLLAFVSIAGWLYVKNLPLDNGLLGGVQPPLRSVLNLNEKLFNKIFSSHHLVKTYPASRAARKVRVNGDIGMGPDFDPANWKLQVIRSGGDTLNISLEEIKKLPRTEITFDFKCIEGWSQVTRWAGVRFSDFANAFQLYPETSMKYVGMSTPDLEYYVGIDMPSALHPQTLICYEMNGQPLPLNQGYPLRMIIPVKYGIKSIKRIGTMYFDNDRPPDYWFERGYDYYSGL